MRCHRHTSHVYSAVYKANIRYCLVTICNFLLLCKFSAIFEISLHLKCFRSTSLQHMTYDKKRDWWLSKFSDICQLLGFWFTSNFSSEFLQIADLKWKKNYCQIIVRATGLKSVGCSVFKSAPNIPINFLYPPYLLVRFNFYPREGIALIRN